MAHPSTTQLLLPKKKAREFMTSESLHKAAISIWRKEKKNSIFTTADQSLMAQSYVVQQLHRKRPLVWMPGATHQKAQALLVLVSWHWGWAMGGGVKGQGSRLSRGTSGWGKELQQLNCWWKSKRSIENLGVASKTLFQWPLCHTMVSIQFVGCRAGIATHYETVCDTMRQLEWPV